MSPVDLTGILASSHTLQLLSAIARQHILRLLMFVGSILSRCLMTRFPSFPRFWRLWQPGDTQSSSDLESKSEHGQQMRCQMSESEMSGPKFGTTTIRFTAE